MNTDEARKSLLEAKDIFDKNGVEFFLICGTCLGALRIGDIFPFDGDIDLGVKHEILIDNLDPLEESFLEKGYSVEYRWCQFGYKRSVDYRRGDVHICVRDYALSGDKRFHARIIAPDNNTPDGTCSIFNKNLFENMTTLKIRDVEFLVPTPAEDFMLAHYGDWKTERQTDHRCQADVLNSFHQLMENKK